MRDEIKCVLQRRALVGECPRWHPTERALYWVDIYEPSLNRFDPKTGENRRWAMPERIGCFAFRKAGGIIAGMTYGAKKDRALEHFEAAIRLFPESAIARIEYANGLLLLFGKSREAQAVKLYREAAACTPADAMERLDVELARSKLA